MSNIADNSADTGSQGRPDYLLDKFDTPEAQARAYQEAEKLSTQKAQEAADANRRAQQLEGQLQELSAQQDMLYQSIQQGGQGQQQQYDPSADPLVLAYEQAVENGDARAQLGIHAVVAQQAAEAQMRQFATQQQQANQPDPVTADAQGYMFAMLADNEMEKQFGPEWQDLRAEVGELVRHNPYLVPPTAHPLEAVKGLKMATEIVQARRLVEQSNSLGNQNDALNAAMKRQAQTMTGNNGPATSTDQLAEWKEKIANAGGYGYGG